MAADPGALRRFVNGPLHGVALALYFALLPFVVVTKWSGTRHQSDATLVRALLVALALIWLVFAAQLIRNVRRLRHGRRVGPGGNAWLATLIVAMLPYLLTGHHPTVVAPPAIVARHVGDRDAARPGGRPVAVSAVPLALVARRRRDELRRGGAEVDDAQVDDAIDMLRSFDPDVIERLRRQIGDRLDGVVRVGDDPGAGAITSHSDSPVVTCVVRDEPGDVMISFAREGGVLRVPVQWSGPDITDAAVGLHDGGRLAFTRAESELLRALATRSLHHTLVVFLGPAGALDEELRACSVTLAPVLFDDRGASAPSSGHRYLPAAPTACDGAVRVELLRADPRVGGLDEPFEATLRRRCVEMVAYLALHRHEPVTGDRLRTRVLARADVDASVRTLANTASAVRRSLGVDMRGPRLHPVTSSGLYVTHSVTSDLELFDTLVARARTMPLSDAAPLLERALALVHGEPLASALRGYEWFLAEGFAARLSRDGEWAALALSRHALEAEDFETAFWALSQGRLIDPYSDALEDALRRVPRLREFGGDGARGAQHLAVGAGGAVEAGGALARLVDEVVQ